MKARALLVLPLLCILCVSSAHAVPLIPEFRPRVGAGINPDQFVFGLQGFLRGHLLGIARLAPSVDAGYGNDVNATLINLDLLSGRFPLGRSNLNLYGGIGGSVAFFSSTGNSNTEWGGNIIGGVDIGERFYGEARFGLDKMPDVRLLAGIRLIKK